MTLARLPCPCECCVKAEERREEGAEKAPSLEGPEDMAAL